jgi:hypothetical protein
MSTKARYENSILRYYESTTQETIHVMAPVVFWESFLGKAFDTTNIWTALDTSAAGNTTPVLVNDASNGVLSIPLDATNEVQLSGLTWGDQRTLTLNQGLNVEFRFRFSVLPTGAVTACLGLCGDHNAAANTVAESIWFRADGNGVLTVETDDTVNETSQVATGVTLTTNDWTLLRIDCTTINNILFYINGNRVASGTTFNMSQVAALALQPVVRIGKESAATTVGTIQLDKVLCWQNR